MTDKEIKSALICCDFPTDELCCKCCFKGEENCTGKLTQATIDLINRLQKSKEYYKKNRDEYQDKAMFIAKQCDELQEEINRQQAEIERLKEDNFIKSQKRANIFEIVNAHEKGRAEAVKEFAERLKENTVIVKIGEQTCRVITVDGIDYYKKEMVGEQE